MRRLFLPLPTGSSKSQSHQSLRDFLIAHIESSPGNPISADFAETMIRQGSIWFGNERVKDPSINIAALYDPRERELAISKRQSGHAGRAAKAAKPKTHPKIDGEVDLHEMRYGPWLQVFYPEKPITEYTLNPGHIKFEDADFLIVYKEAMLNTCQSVFSDTNCLTWGVQKYLNEKGNAESYQVNTINRLDYATRGLVFYAKHKPAEVALHRMFMNRHIHKRYLVVTPIFNFPKPQDIEAKTPSEGRVRVSNTGSFNLKIQDTLEWQGKIQQSSTLIHWMGEDRGRFVWIALPQTGRTHQIRKHFARYLVPIQGDPVYGPELYGSHDDLMLACISYRFRHPMTGQSLRVEFLPQDMNLECSADRNNRRVSRGSH